MRAYPLERLAAWDRALCKRFNGISDVVYLRRLLLIASRLGDGVFWYGLMAALIAFNGTTAIQPVLHMVAVGLVCTLLYKSIKVCTSRPRPYAAQADITLFAAPLDQYSFPSGHTLHAVAFSLVALTYYPALVWLVLPFTTVVGLSRVVLGLHYPSDVIAGAVLGAFIAGVSSAYI
ncbi:MAG: undecaprenyl-diphosphatase [Betaproteobacteria bacterium]|jgi:undecaprenyl-diphosphatase